MDNFLFITITMNKNNNSKITHAQQLAQELNKLDLSNPTHVLNYQKLRYIDFALIEGIKDQAYDDLTGLPIREAIKISGKRTIGIGFNLDDTDAKKTWHSVFSHTKDFDDARNGMIKLKMAEVEKLFAVTIGIREKYIEQHYGHVLKYLHPGIRLALEDLCYNAYSLIGPKTSLYRYICAHGIAIKNMQNALNTVEKEEYFKQAQYNLFLALLEIKYKSNRYSVPGLYIRREMTAIKANIYKFDLGTSLAEAKFLSQSTTA